MVRTLVLIWFLLAVTHTGTAVAAETGALPNVDAWANFSFHETFNVEPPKDLSNGVRIMDARQLFARIHPEAKPDDKSVREVETTLAGLLKVRRMDWSKYMVIAYFGGYSRFREDARLDLRWLPAGKLEARWTPRETGMGTCSVGAFALVEKSDAEIVFAKARYFDE